jgi:hypothetical protein
MIMAFKLKYKIELYLLKYFITKMFMNFILFLTSFLSNSTNYSKPVSISVPQIDYIIIEIQDPIQLA